MKKGKAVYVTHQKKGETGRECTQDDVDLDMKQQKPPGPTSSHSVDDLRIIQHWAQEQ